MVICNFLFFVILKICFTLQTPVVFWHGMGDNGKNPAFSKMGEIIKKHNPGTYIKSLVIGSNIFQDVENSFLMNINSQIEMVCEELRKDQKLKEGFHLVGFSQGGQFSRGLVQRCATIKVKNLISIAGQHQGVFGLPECLEESVLCKYMRTMVSRGAYEDHIQKHIVQAQYWHDPFHEQLFKSKSLFLADINQENEVKEQYKENMEKLEHFVLVKCLNDSVVVPVESEWFGYYKEGQVKDVYDLRDSILYQKDKLNLRKLDEEGRLVMLSVEGDHLRFSLQWFEQEIALKFLQ